MSALDDLKITERNMAQKVNEKRKEADECKRKADDLRKEADQMEQQAKEHEKNMLLMMSEMGVMRKNAEAAAAAEKRFNEKS